MKGGPMALFLSSPFSVNKTTRLSVFEPDPSKIGRKGKHGVLAPTIQTSAPGDLRFIQ
jgi:hypothetical protein